MSPDIARILKQGSPLHTKIEKALANRLRLSEGRFKDRYAGMARNEELFQAYIPEREVDRLRRQNREQYGIPDYRTIELPYSYSVAMTAHTYYSSVFLSRNPIFQLMGRHGESEQKVQAMETLLAYQISIGCNLVPLYVWLLDPAKYGFGVIGHHWDKEAVRVRRMVQEQPSFFGVPIPGAAPKTVSKVEDVVGYEGNRIYNVRAQDFFPDPRTALVHFQRGEFCGRYTEVPWNEIYAGSRNGNYRYFNYDALQKARNQRDHDQSTGVITRDQGSGNVTTLPNQSSIEGAYDVPVGYIKGHEIYLKLRPSEWGLGANDVEEIWAFNRSANGIIFGAGPLGEYSGKFPFDLLLDEVDGYTLFPRATLERCKPLNDVMTWLINAHFYNVRQVLNGQFVIDPSAFVMKDFENPQPGRGLRLKPEAYGRDVRTALTQLQSMDVTRGHIADLNLMMEMVQRMVPANDSLMGVQPTGSGRQTATSVRTSTHFGTSRLKTQCEWYSASGWTPLTQKLVQRTQQNYDSTKQFQIVGDLAQFTTGFIEVNPDLIAGFFDYEPVDGTLPIDRFAQANLWQQIMGQMVNFPQVMATYDIAKIFAWVAQLGGIKNLAQFRLTQDAALMQQAQAGNVVPISAANKAIGANPQEPGQIPNLGATG